jgi:hypothetical protein
LHEYRRVVPNRVDGIGEPLNIFTTTLHVAILVNAGLITNSFGATRGLAPSQQVWFAAGFIALMLLFLAVLGAVFPDMPEKTAIQLERQRVVYERVVMGMNDDDGETLELGEHMLGRSLKEVNEEKRRALEADPLHVQVEVLTDDNVEAELAHLQADKPSPSFSSRPESPPPSLGGPLRVSGGAHHGKSSTGAGGSGDGQPRKAPPSSARASRELSLQEAAPPIRAGRKSTKPGSAKRPSSSGRDNGSGVETV